ncbi:TPT-domain-containing protein [Lentinus tigrinus ALCF2SS1-7]|uniref:TPT-domain-containing protein n=1 Tax=Lentinus tigrinus ALCF2SS1-6 TaxID=1328759 RepID=A0A5C2SEH6_9APHY|nr:TPT-domain-containing protein [Lentinus tigrinus ALCF2SS1-6]RPD76197.1 TPT-domain-containing protein [Lentinus tigrinus ALCF2SS1-7]
MAWRDFTRSQPGIGSSPRQRPNFARDVASTPAFLLSQSPLARDSGFPSPSLPFVAPSALVASKSNLAARRTQKKIIPRRRLADSQVSWLSLYFAFNLGLTLYNKSVLVRFPYPYTLTAVHALFGSIGGYILRQRNVYTPAQLNFKSYVVLAAYSVLFAVNIAVSNLSLQLVTIPFHQVVRAATPIFTTLISLSLFGTRFNNAKMFTLVPVMLGVILATYGDYYFTPLGLLLTLFGTFLAALKTIYTNILQSSTSASTSQSPSSPSFLARLFVPPRLNLHPLDLLTRMSPLAFIQCAAYAYYSGELSRMRTVVIHSGATLSGWWYFLLLLGNGCIAFGLNVVSFTANGKVGALNMTVAANIKQVLTILLAVAIFNLTITAANAAGIMITIAGGAWYAWIEHGEKAARRAEKNAGSQ